MSSRNEKIGILSFLFVMGILFSAMEAFSETIGYVERDGINYVVEINGERVPERLLNKYDIECNLVKLN